MKQKYTIGVVGAGAWGTALAMAFSRAQCEVTLWSLNSGLVEAIETRHENTFRLPGISLNPLIKATTDFQDLKPLDVLVLATPAQKLREFLENYSADISNSTPLVLTSKGIELGSGKLLTEIIPEYLPQNPIAILSGPSFAMDVAKKLPTAVTLATTHLEWGQALTHAFSSQYFRPYYSADMIGAQMGGALKNVLAIASGILQGKGFGENARAALITRGLVEIQRLGVTLGANPETFYGLSGVGDLMLSCYSEQSRNMSLGIQLGHGKVLSNEESPLTEGVYTAASLMILAKKHQVEMPICEAVDHIVNHNGNIETTIERLLSRPLKAE
ncbi:NAD(P)-dependent glycerol-3-phosphate dehydrogenase [Candidatus Bealeia paramacronuclearis]|uniref:Glycerol-3-phosphate dehydrogenase [NAD(P)+] n=1 Tax=Candidatus Bealeia paramacronuclearis TaxID=1921001 RepID=A0ABZ2C110_9PROT|nr:NAD(P)-dependent glycerol-3-phosphate dehydrogenase [Candidatus Bealeia paramacronuclearis]